MLARISGGPVVFYDGLIIANCVFFFNLFIYFASPWRNVKRSWFYFKTNNIKNRARGGSDDITARRCDRLCVALKEPLMVLMAPP